MCKAFSSFLVTNLFASDNYLLLAWAPAWQCGKNRARLRNATAGSTVKVGPNGYNGGSEAVSTLSPVMAAFTANGTDAYEIQHYTAAAKTSTGLGYALNVSGESEVYTNVLLIRRNS
jgi:hypothetical protein